ncbi:helix-turn-helix domain-containing protein [Shinella sp.]|uniref:helix-turn-helix domain-containing protein n=1 Tax=Shinella sp. TaxID=1870904 RepID=UPI0040359036
MSLGGTDLGLSGPSLVWAPAGARGSVTFDAGAEGAALAIPELALRPAMPTGAIFAEVRDALARLMMEAEMLLGGSSLQIAEVAEALGFRDAAYFSRFFKRLAGVSPRARRAGLVSRQVREETSYAAWP